MTDMFFVVSLGYILACFLGWAFRRLPGEGWQMLAVFPAQKSLGNNSWHGINFTYYGFFIATGQLLALLLLLVLLGAMHASLAGSMLIILILLGACLPASRLVAMIVEKKRHTFTVGGASCVGMLLAPWVVWAVQELLADQGSFLPVIPVLAAMSIAYTLGEGLGRLGCISFGCCYGKPLKDCHWLLRRLFARRNFIFQGATKKAVYEGRLEGERLIPIQAITCVVYTCGALLGTMLFLAGCFSEALLLTVVLTQSWRILSETVRADFRGFGRISAYQKMGIVSAVYMVMVTAIVPAPKYILPHVAFGLEAVWNPLIILAVQILWLVFFLVFGRSTVTGSTVCFHLHQK